MSDEVRDARRGVFWMHDDILDLYGARLGVYGVAVYALLCRRANARATCWPSLNGIARDLGVSRSKVVATLDAVEGLGLIRRTKRRNEKDGHASTLYTILELPPLVADENKGCSQEQQPLVRTRSTKDATRKGRHNKGRPQTPGGGKEEKNYMEGFEHLLTAKKRRAGA